MRLIKRYVSNIDGNFHYYVDSKFPITFQLIYEKLFNYEEKYEKE